MDLLFARLSPELRIFAIRKVGRFLATTSLPSMTAEASVLAQAAAASDATAAAQHILEPLLAQIDAELPGFHNLSSGQLSKVALSCHNNKSTLCRSPRCFLVVNGAFSILYPSQKKPFSREEVMLCKQQCRIALLGNMSRRSRYHGRWAG